MKFRVLRYLHKSIFFNFYYLPFKKAIRLPIIFVSNVKFVSLKGKIDIKGDVHFAMVIIGGVGNALYEQNNHRTVWANHGGTCVFSNANRFCRGLAVEIGRLGKLEFGENIYFGPCVRLACFDHIKVGDNSRIAWECILLDTDFHSTINVESGNRSTLTSPIFIGKNNWIGIRSLVLKGTKTPDFSVISAYSLLNKKFDTGEYSLLGGIPAKHIASGIYRDLTSHVFNNYYIVNADDFGLKDSINKAIDYCFTNRIISSTTMIVNGEYFDEAVDLSKQNGYSKYVGLHFNIVEGKPLTKEILSCNRFCDSQGYFNYRRNSILKLSPKERNALKVECLAQIKKMREKGLSISHFDSHQHVHTEWPIFRAIYTVLLEQGIRFVRIPTNIGTNGFVKKIYKRLYVWGLDKYGFKTTDFFGYYHSDSISRIKDNARIIELMLHPDFDCNGQLYDHVLNDGIQNNNFKLLNYSDLNDKCI